MKLLRLSIILLLGFVALFPFLVTIISLNSVSSNIEAEGKNINHLTTFHEERKKFQQKSDRTIAYVAVQEGKGPAPRQCQPGSCSPRRYFATTSHPNNASYYLEPADSTGKNGIYSDIPSRPWNEFSLTPLDYSAERAPSLVRQTIEGRLEALIESDRVSPEQNLPKYLPPQFPQWDRSIHRQIVSSSTIIGMPPECCPSNIVHQHLTKNFSAQNVLSEDQLRDCECRYPRNYPTANGPTSTLVTAFYQMSSKHPVKMYEKTSTQLLATSDPMVIFCQPNSTWVDFFVQNRKHAPTVVVPLDANELRLVKHFPRETFWKKQYEIDPEASTHHKGVNTMLYVIWDEKLVLLHSAAMLNPFNSTQFVWVDTGYWRNPAPHLYRNSAVMINITEEGVKDESTLLFQMRDYNFDRDLVISGDQVLVGGNCFAGTYTGISNLYSAFYETFWAMASTGKFVGSDQKVLYRTCHTYPAACHIHKPRKMRSWLAMLGELLPGIGREKIGKPLKMAELIAAEKNLPVPPNGIVNDATSAVTWKRVKR